MGCGETFQVSELPVVHALAQNSRQMGLISKEESRIEVGSRWGTGGTQLPGSPVTGPVGARVGYAASSLHVAVLVNFQDACPSMRLRLHHVTATLQLKPFHYRFKSARESHVSFDCSDTLSGQDITCAPHL